MAPMALCCSSSAASSDAPSSEGMSSAKWIGSYISNYHAKKMKLPIHRAEEIPHLTLGTWKRPYLGVCVILEWLGSASSTVGNSRIAEEAVLRPSRPLAAFSSSSSLSERNATEGIRGGGEGDDALCSTAPLLGGAQQHGEKVVSRELPRVASLSNPLRDAACKHYALNF